LQQIHHWQVAVVRKTNITDSGPDAAILPLLGSPHGTATLDGYTERKIQSVIQYRDSAMHSHIRPNTHVALRLPSGLFKVLEITPNTYVA
jgi:hypothetical protein